MHKRHKIQFPKAELSKLDQNESYFFLENSVGPKKILFHDYAKIYKIPGLYEQIFYDRLKCKSPEKVASILQSAVLQSNDNFTELRVLDFGAGNGIMGEELKKQGVARLVGVDIITEAMESTMRDRPDLYDAYYVEDFTKLNPEKRNEIASWQCDCMVSVAALGFGDIPAQAFIEAFNIIKPKGWVAFNIQVGFLDKRDRSGFSSLIRKLFFSDILDIYHVERYRHRLSIEGEPIYYFAIAARKNADIPADFHS